MSSSSGTDLEILAQAAGILSREMKPSTMARLVGILGIGQGDYTELRNQLFGDETLESLLNQVRRLREEKAGQTRKKARSRAASKVRSRGTRNRRA